MLAQMEDKSISVRLAAWTVRKSTVLESEDYDFWSWDTVWEAFHMPHDSKLYQHWKTQFGLIFHFKL